MGCGTQSVAQGMEVLFDEEFRALFGIFDHRLEHMWRTT